MEDQVEKIIKEEFDRLVAETPNSRLVTERDTEYSNEKLVSRDDESIEYAFASYNSNREPEYFKL